MDDPDLAARIDALTRSVVRLRLSSISTEEKRTLLDEAVSRIDELHTAVVASRKKLADNRWDTVYSRKK